MVGVSFTPSFRDPAAEAGISLLSGRWSDAEPVGLVFAVRETDEEPKLAGLPELRVHGLGF
jgi:hypothetical protein